MAPRGPSNQAAALESTWRDQVAELGDVPLVEVLGELGALGFAWRDVARFCGVSVAQLRDWRRGSQASNGAARELLGLCHLLARTCAITDPASWLETFIGKSVVSPLQLVIEGRCRLVLEMAAGAGSDEVLEQLAGDPRLQHASTYEVFVAADGAPGLRARSAPASS